jgi:uncharacterized protein YggE
MEKSKVWFWILFDIFIGVGVIVLLLGASSLARWGSSLPPARTVSVSAQGKTTATPDLAELTFSVVTQGKTPADLSSTNDQKMSAVVSFVASQGIASSDIQTVGYDLEPIYSSEPVQVQIYPPYIPVQPQTIVGYTLTDTVQVKIHDLTKVADVLGGLAPLGVNQIGGVSFTFNNPDSFTAIARADALKKAQAKAAEMATEAGASLGAVVNLNESSYLPVVERTAYSMNASVAVPSAAAPPVSPGTQDITDTVTVTYSLN